MAKTIKLEVVTPEKLFYQGEVEIVIARTLTGDEGFMANHVWACKLLDTGELWFREAGEKTFKVAAIAGGFVDVKDEVMVFTNSAEWPEGIDIERTKLAKQKAEEWFKSAVDLVDMDEKEIEDKKNALKRAENRLSVSAGGKRSKN